MRPSAMRWWAGGRLTNFSAASSISSHPNFNSFSLTYLMIRLLLYMWIVFLWTSILLTKSAIFCYNIFYYIYFHHLSLHSLFSCNWRNCICYTTATVVRFLYFEKLKNFFYILKNWRISFVFWRIEEFFLYFEELKNFFYFEELKNFFIFWRIEDFLFLFCWRSFMNNSCQCLWSNLNSKSSYEFPAFKYLKLSIFMECFHIYKWYFYYLFQIKNWHLRAVSSGDVYCIVLN